MTSGRSETRPALTELLARAEVAEGPDRVLDLLIFAGMDPLSSGHQMMSDPGRRDGSRGSWFVPAQEFTLEKWAGREAEAADWHNPPDYTASLDDVLALVERKLGDWPLTILDEAIEDMGQRGYRMDQPFAPQLARYVLAALLKALIAVASGEAAAPLPTEREDSRASLNPSLPDPPVGA